MPSSAGRHRVKVASRPGRARVWTGVAIVCAAIGIWALLPVVLPAADPGWSPSGPALANAPAVRPVGPPAAEPMSTSVPVSLSISALGVSADVVRLGLEDDGSMEVPQGASVAGWYEEGPTPGETGPAVLAAHVDWADEPGVFHDIRDLQAGDEVVVSREDGSVATFRVELVTESAKSDFPTDAVYGDLDHAGLRLITCGGEFDESSGDYADNVVVFASLTG